MSDNHLASTALAASFAAAIAILPTLLLLGRAGWRRLRRGADAKTSATSRAARAARAARASRAAREESLREVTLREGSQRCAGTLRAARESAAGRRLHVSFAMGQAGWAILVVSLTPLAISAAVQPIDAIIGNAQLWLVPAPLGICLFLLALFPTDARFIRVVSATLLVVCTGLGASSTWSALTDRVPDRFGYLLAALDFAFSCSLLPTLRCRGYRAMQPRPALQWLWTVTRLNLLCVGVLSAGFNIADFAQGGDNHHWAGAGLSATSLLMAALATRRNRGRIHRRLGRLGGRGSDAEEAAAVAALVGGSDSDDTLQRAMDLFRCLPVGQLFAADLATNTTVQPTESRPAGRHLKRSIARWSVSSVSLPPTSAATAAASSESLPRPNTTVQPTELTLHERTEPAVMGEVTAFLSHSWSDEQEVPGAKYAVVSHWAERQQELTGTEPTLWLVALAQSLPLPACSTHAR